MNPCCFETNELHVIYQKSLAKRVSIVKWTMLYLGTDAKVIEAKV